MGAALRTVIDTLERRRARDHRAMRAALASAGRAGHTQREIARLVGRSQPEVHRLMTMSAARTADGSRRTWMTARSAADAAARELRRGDELTALPMIMQSLDHLRLLDDLDDVAEWAVTPVPIPHEGLDTLFQALTRHAFRERGLEVPQWASPQTLDEEWILAAVPSREPRVKARTPEFLAELNVYVSEQDLVTV